MASSRVSGVDLRLAGQQFGGGARSQEELEAREAQARLDALSAWLRGEADEDERALESREVTPRDLLTGPSFALTGAGRRRTASGRISAPVWSQGHFTLRCEDGHRCSGSP